MRKVVTLVAALCAVFISVAAGGSPTVPDATGCQRVPTTGTVNPGGIGTTTLEYSNWWQWSDASASQSFDWSIRKGDGTVVASGSSGGAGSSHSLAANNYFFRIVNRGSVGQFWNVCYDVR